MFGLQEIVAMNEQADVEAKNKRIALIKSELAKCDNVAVKEILSSLAEKE